MPLPEATTGLRQFPDANTFIATLAAEDVIIDSFTLEEHAGHELETVREALRQAESPAEQDDLARYIRGTYCGSIVAAIESKSEWDADPRVDYAVMIKGQSFRLENRYILGELSLQLHRFLELPADQYPGRVTKLARQRKRERAFAIKELDKHSSAVS